MSSSRIATMRSWVKRATRTTEVLALACGAFLSLGCGGSAATPAGVPAPTSSAPVGTDDLSSARPVDFAFDSLDERPVSADAARGKPTVIAFVQTGDVWAQAEVNFLVAMARNDGDAVNYLLVALEPRDARELVESYRTVLGVKFPVALADTATMFGAGPFGAIKVPSLFILDRTGRIAWRAEARVAKADEIRAHLRGL
jgi:hypothetical protein